MDTFDSRCIPGYIREIKATFGLPFLLINRLCNRPVVGGILSLK